MDLVQGHFRKAASSFDSLYDEDSPVQKVLRPTLFNRREGAARLVRTKTSPRVLDIGCGSGRVAERLLESGAGSYVGVDFSEPMIALASERLARFGDKVTLLTGDFLGTEIEGPFDVVIAVGFWDYIAEPDALVRKMFSLTAEGGVTYGSFPRWTWSKGPFRYVRYEVVNHCPIFNYTERELQFLFRAAGFSRVDLEDSGDGWLVYATR